jgi:CBS domain-containing protein
MHDHFEGDEAYMAEPHKGALSTLTASTLERPIRDLPIGSPFCLEETRSAHEAITAMREKKIGSILVTRGGKLCGIFTERDILNKMALGERDARKTRLSEVMFASPETLTPETPMAYALKTMTLGGFRHVPLADAGGRPVGVVSVRDIVAYIVDHFTDQVMTTPPEHGGEIARSREGA